jgi:predicted acylesterase/phospholipase RssA
MNLAAAASALRRLPLFERVSLRLLHDLVDYASRQRWLDDDDAGAPAHTRPQGERPTIRKLGLLRGRTPARRITDRDFRRGWLEDALDASFSLERALLGQRDTFFDVLAGERPERQRPDPLPLHLLFLTKHERFGLTPTLAPDADLVSMGTLLANALVRTTVDLPERAVLAVLDQGGITLRFVDGPKQQGGVPVPFERLETRGACSGQPGDFPVTQLLTEISKAAGLPADHRDTVWHVVAVHPADPWRLPAWWTDRFHPSIFHRLVYLIRNERFLEPPEVLYPLLRRKARGQAGQGPYFCSVIPTVVLPPARPQRGTPWLRMPWEQMPTMEVVPWFDAADASAAACPTSPADRLRRDLCRVRVDLHQQGTCDRAPELAASLDRWARAVTNRQVGLALGGGGATSAALVPFVEEIRKAGIPIDVVSGLSGGAVLGMYVATDQIQAYYSRMRRLALGLILPAAICDSQAIEWWVNWELGTAHLEDLDVRFVPVTAELRTDASPRACAVIGGTVGEAVRASSTALGLFGPSERRNRRYVDGGVVTGLPTGLMPAFGADLVIACNSIVPPDGRAAFVPRPVAELTRLHPLVDRLFGRIVDSGVGLLTMLRQMARDGAAQNADVYYEVSAEETPFVTAFLWAQLDVIRKTALEGRQWEDELVRCIQRWRLLRGL